MGAPVIISISELTHERPLGAGFVRPPQIDGKSVVTLDSLHPDAEKFVKTLLDPSTHKETVAKVRIGPGYDLQNLRQPPTANADVAANPMAEPKAIPHVEPKALPPPPKAREE
jgi:hypothetical protein